MNDEPKLTPWFGWNTKPARVGVYEAEWRSGTYYNYWDGKEWHWGSSSSDVARRDDPVSRFERARLLRWRGLAEAPAA